VDVTADDQLFNDHQKKSLLCEQENRKYRIARRRREMRRNAPAKSVIAPMKSERLDATCSRSQ
jgi:hypothetical protein